MCGRFYTGGPAAQCSRALPVRVFAISTIALALASCTPKPPVQVSIPVIAPCIKPTQIPTLPVALADMPADANAALALALDSLIAWKAYGVEADGKLRACSVVR